jgi:hypothetical protein
MFGVGENGHVTFATRIFLGMPLRWSSVLRPRANFFDLLLVDEGAPPDRSQLATHWLNKGKTQLEFGHF